MVIARFDVFKNPSGAKAYPYLVVLQHELLDALPTRAVIPLVPKALAGAMAITRLNPTFVVERVPCLLLTQELGAVRAASLKIKVGSLAARGADVLAAVDVLLSGV